MNENLLPLYRQAVELAKNELPKKAGASLAKAWLEFNPFIMTEILFGKINKITEIESGRAAKTLQEYIQELYLEFINYTVATSYQISNPQHTYGSMDNTQFLKGYNEEIERSINLMQNKGGCYQVLHEKLDPRYISKFITDKLKETINKYERKVVSPESVGETYYEITNYAIFYLMKMAEEKK